MFLVVVIVKEERSRKEAGSYCVTELGQTRIIFSRKGQNFQLENSPVAVS